MERLRTLIFIAAVGISLGGTYLLELQKKEVLPVLPDGYRVLCSTDGGKYSLIDPDGWQFPVVWVSRDLVVRFAILWEKNEPPPPPISAYKWEDCGATR